MKNVFYFLSTMIFLTFASTAFGFGSFGTTVNNNTTCQPYTGDCSLCHTGSYSNSTPAKSAYSAGNWDYFCPTQPVDSDNDGYADADDCAPNDASIFPGANDVACDGIDQDCSGADSVDATCTDSDNDGSVDSVDCAPNDDSIFPGADEVCGDGIDQDCNGSDLDCAPPEPGCTNLDGDDYAIEGGDCGPVDCNDEVAAINPGAAESCGDNIDNNCDGLTDGQDTVACPPQPECNDFDQDNFFAEEGCNTTLDCDDNDAQTYPGATELCGDQIDNDCDGSVDEGCDIVDNDGPGLYQDLCASCHGEQANSDVCGDDAEDIREAIHDNEGGMGNLSSLTDAQIEMIAQALSNCNGGDDDDDDDDRDRDDDDRDYRRDRGDDDDRDRDDDDRDYRRDRGDDDRDYRRDRGDDDDRDRDDD